MKKIYFVRHGESEGNAGPLRQSAETPLTEIGRRQAEFVAKRCAKIPIETIICSTMVRARETADLILKKTKNPIQYSDLFIEKLRPSITFGKPKNDPLSVEIESTIDTNFCTPNYRYTDEENFSDLKTRAQKALHYLSEFKEENILVVTHGYFMRILIAYATFGEELTANECLKFIKGFHMENTGLSVLGYDKERTNSWRLWVWNDHAHLG